MGATLFAMSERRKSCPYLHPYCSTWFNSSELQAIARKPTGKNDKAIFQTKINDKTSSSLTKGYTFSSRPRLLKKRRIFCSKCDYIIFFNSFKSMHELLVDGMQDMSDCQSFIMDSVGWFFSTGDKEGVVKFPIQLYFLAVIFHFP